MSIYQEDLHLNHESLTQLPRPVMRTNNAIKKELFSATFPFGQILEDKFVEDQIKAQVGVRSGFEHFAEIAAGKVEHVIGHEVQFAADSGMVFEQEGEWIPVDRDNSAHSAEVLKMINERGYTVFIGALSVNSEGGVPYTIQSYIKIPLEVKDPIKTHPFSYEELERRHKASGQKAEYGFIDTQVQNGKILYEFVQTGNTKQGDLEEIYPHLSGITDESLKVLYEAVLVNNALSPLLRDTISAFPFNTFKYLLPGFQRNYKDLVTHNGGLTDGGDCNAFTAYLAEKLAEMGIQFEVGVYDAARPTVPFAHTDIMLKGEHGIYACETGLSIPYVIPLTARSLAPIRISENKRVIPHYEKNNTVIYIERESQGQKRIGDVPLRNIISADQLPEQISQTIEDLTVARNGLLRFEQHDKNGIKQYSFYLDRQGGLRTQIGENKFEGNILNMDLVEIKALLEPFGISAEQIVEVYNFWIQYVPENGNH